MNSFKINLNTFEKIKEFINVIYRVECNLKLTSGRHVVNGKSLMGIFSLDLTKPIDVIIINEKQNPNYFPKELEAFM